MTLNEVLELKTGDSLEYKEAGEETTGHVLSVKDSIVIIKWADEKENSFYNMEDRWSSMWLPFTTKIESAAPVPVDITEIISEEEQARRGELVADCLRLSKNHDGRYVTDWGTKTPLGLFRTIESIIRTGN